LAVKAVPETPVISARRMAITFPLHDTMKMALP
jgi:hypothetical protein